MRDLEHILEVLEDAKDFPNIDTLTNRQLIDVLIYRVRAEIRTSTPRTKLPEKDSPND